MISDDIKDDDILEDDFDIDDFEDDWDDQDQLADEGVAGEQPVAAVANGEKSFLQKFFLPIVVGVVVIFGLLFAASQGLFSSAPESVNGEEEAMVAADGSDAASINEAPTLDEADVLLVEPEETYAPMPSEDAPLTPLPGDEASEQMELADLEAELEEDTSNDFLNETPDLIDTPQDVEDPTENLFGVTPDEVAEDTSNDNDIETLDAMTLSDNGDELPMAEDDLFNDNANNNPIDDVTSSENDMSVETSTATNTDAGVDTDLLESQKAELMQNNKALEETISDNRETIDALKAEITSLKDQIASMDNASPAKPVTKPAEQEMTKPEPVEQAAPVAKPVKKAPTWTLKSAQPGKATIAPLGSNDLRNIETGNTVSGLGRITSIRIEDGKWVVRGTLSSISQ